MKYTPKRTDLKIRLIYAASFLLAVFCMIFNGLPQYKTYFSSAGLLFLVASLYLFIKFEFTTYEYILIERNDTLDFYVNKIVGRRGSYVCYFPLTDACELCEYSSELKKALNQKYSNISFYKYNQNILCGKKYALIFKDGEKHLAIIFEPNEEFITMVQNEILRQDKIRNSEDEIFIEAELESNTCNNENFESKNN